MNFEEYLDIARRGGDMRPEEEILVDFERYGEESAIPPGRADPNYPRRPSREPPPPPVEPEPPVNRNPWSSSEERAAFASDYMFQNQTSREPTDRQLARWMNQERQAGERAEQQMLNQERRANEQLATRELREAAKAAADAVAEYGEDRWLWTYSQHLRNAGVSDWRAATRAEMEQNREAWRNVGQWLRDTFTDTEERQEGRSDRYEPRPGRQVAMQTAFETFFPGRDAPGMLPAEATHQRMATEQARRAGEQEAEAERARIIAERPEEIQAARDIELAGTSAGQQARAQLGGAAGRGAAALAGAQAAETARAQATPEAIQRARALRYEYEKIEPERRELATATRQGAQEFELERQRERQIYQNMLRRRGQQERVHQTASQASLGQQLSSTNAPAFADTSRRNEPNAVRAEEEVVATEQPPTQPPPTQPPPPATVPPVETTPPVTPPVETPATPATETGGQRPITVGVTISITRPVPGVAPFEAPLTAEDAQKFYAAPISTNDRSTWFTTARGDQIRVTQERKDQIMAAQPESSDANLKNVVLEKETKKALSGDVLSDEDLKLINKSITYSRRGR